MKSFAGSGLFVWLRKQQNEKFFLAFNFDPGLPEAIDEYLLLVDVAIDEVDVIVVQADEVVRDYRG